MIARMYYCGQRARDGHYIWPSDGSDYQLSMEKVEPEAPFEDLDDPDRWCGRHEQGLAKLTYIEGWTVFGFREYSLDTRPGSHSTFAAKGTYTAAEMESEARRLFPEVWSRFKFAVSVVT
jgi:hypothetical protein